MFFSKLLKSQPLYLPAVLLNDEYIDSPQEAHNNSQKHLIFFLPDWVAQSHLVPFKKHLLDPFTLHSHPSWEANALYNETGWRQGKPYSIVCSYYEKH